MPTHADASTDHRPSNAGRPGEDGVRAVLAAYVDAHEARSAEGILGVFTADAVRYTLAPPLSQDAGTAYGTVEGVRGWLATFDGPIVLHHQQPAITLAGDVAFVHTLTSMTATPSGSPGSFTFWFRSTFGLRRIGGAWHVTHQHESTPFHMDGSFRAATDLQP